MHAVETGRIRILEMRDSGGSTVGERCRRLGIGRRRGIKQGGGRRPREMGIAALMSTESLIGALLAPGASVARQKRKSSLPPPAVPSSPTKRHSPPSIPF